MLILKIFLFVISIKTLHSNFTENESNNIIYGKAIANICAKSWRNFEVYLIKSIKVENGSLFNDLLQEVAIKISASKAIQIEDSGNIRDMKTRKRGFAIVFIDDFESFLYFVRKITTKTFKFRGFYLIVPMSNTVDVRKIFEVMWNIMIYNVDVMLYNWQLESIDLITFVPFSEAICANMKPMKFNEFKKSTMRWRSNIFFPRKFQNLQLCPVRVGTYETAPGLIVRTIDNVTQIHGFEGHMFNNIAKRLNFTMNISAVTYGGGDIFENGTATGLLEKLVLNEFDMIMSLFSVNILKNIYLTPTKPYYVDKLIVIIPADKNLDSFLKIFYVFDRILWLTLFTIYALTCFAIKLVHSRFKILNEIRNPFLCLLVAVVGGSEKKLPRKNFPRILIATSLLLCMVVRSVYQGGLFNILKEDIRVNQIKTLDDVNKLHYNFIVTQSTENKIKNMQIFHR